MLDDRSVVSSSQGVLIAYFSQAVDAMKCAAATAGDDNALSVGADTSGQELRLAREIALHRARGIRCHVDLPARDVRYERVDGGGCRCVLCNEATAMISTFILLS